METRRMNKYMKQKIVFCLLLVMSMIAGNTKPILVNAVSVTNLTAQEIILYANHPINALKAKEAAEDAEDATAVYWKKYTRTQGNGDAFRHAYWSALMTKKISKSFAYEAGLAHEGLTTSYSFNQLNDDCKMDVSNNYSGRDIGERYSNYKDNVIKDVVNTYVKLGKLKRIRVYSKDSSSKTRYTGYYVKTSDGGYKG